MPALVAPLRADLTACRVVFLAGSIEMGQAENWQQRLSQAVLAESPEIVVANPRRPKWDASWEQSIDNPVFREQVDWELDHLDRADLAVFYFQPGTRSPVTLLELGHRLAGPKARDTLVCCPEGFWRRGNVEVVCARAGLPPPLESLVDLECAAVAWATRPTE